MAENHFDKYDDHPLPGMSARPSQPAAPLPTTPNDISGEGRDEYGNPTRPLAEATPAVEPDAPLASIQNLRRALAPEPGYVRAGPLPFAVKETEPGSGVMDPNSGIAGAKLDLLSPVAGLVNPVLDFMEGTGLSDQGANSPLAGKVSPAGTAFLLGTKMGNPNPFQPRNTLIEGVERGLNVGPPEARPPSSGDLKAAPLPAEFRTAPMSSEGRAAVTAPRDAAPSTPTGIPIQKPAPPAAEGIPPPGTAAYAKHVAAAYYDIADKSGGTLTPKVTNKFVDAVEAVGKQTEAGRAVAGPNEVSSLAERLQSIRDQPMTLRAAQEVDEAMGDLISKQYTVAGLSKDGQKILEAQSNFRHMIENAGEGDITGGTAGFDALGPARKAWSQARKMDDLERIQQRALLTENPATSVRTQIRTLLTSKTKSRGYSPEELAALEDAADRGVVGGALHVFGSRLVPLVAGGAGLASGPATAAALAGAAHVVGAGLRAGSTGIQTRRLNNAIETIGESVPPHPLVSSPGQPYLSSRVTRDLSPASLAAAISAANEERRRHPLMLGYPD